MQKVQDKRAYTNDTPFDDRIHMQANIEDMRASLISEYLYTIGSDLYQESLRRPVVDFAETMRLVGGPSELRKPLNVGLLFFSERPDTYFPYTRIEIVDKPDPTGTGMTEKVVVGPLDRQLRDAISYIRNYVVTEKVMKVSDRAEAIRAFNYPPIAIEEALSNAVWHKSYQIREPITVTITPEKLEISSLPGPDRSITDEDLAERRMVSKGYRNPRIGEFLRELKLVEGRNTGIPAMLRAMEYNGSDVPTFETDEERTYLTVVLPVHPLFLTGSVPTEDITSWIHGDR